MKQQREHFPNISATRPIAGARPTSPQKGQSLTSDTAAANPSGGCRVAPLTPRRSSAQIVADTVKDACPPQGIPRPDLGELELHRRLRALRRILADADNPFHRQLVDLADMLIDSGD